MRKLLQIASAVLVALPVLAHAGNTIQFDADGAGAAYSAQAIDLLDWAPGNALAVGGGGVSPGATTQLLYQANLGLTSLNGTTKTVSCFASASCLTAVAGFQEKVDTVVNNGTTTTATFSLASAPVLSTTNFFYIYAKPATQGDNLLGTGFSTGTAILKGHVTSMSSSNFTLNNSGAVAFDQSGTNNYPGVQTLVGSGATNITILIDFADQSYFPGLTLSGLAFSFFNNSQVTPFVQVDPSQKFSSNGVANGDVTPLLGAVNGLGSAGAGRDFQFLADANQAFLVPEPGSLALVGAALAGLGLASRRRKSV